jgi:MoxR-like ATPase
MKHYSATLRFERRFPTPMDEVTMAKSINHQVSKAIGSLATSGWKARKVKMTASESMTEKPRYHYVAAVNLVRQGQRSFEGEVADKQSEIIAGRIVGRIAGWQRLQSDLSGNHEILLTSLNGRSVISESTDTPIAIPSTPGELLTLPDNYASFFDHIYDREAQIREVLASIATARETDMEVRNHLLLYGPPGCGKTEICLSIWKMFGDLAVKRLDATATTKAGAEKLLLEMDAIPPIVILEEAEKVNEGNLPWLLGILDDRGEIIKTNARVGSVSRPAKCLVIVTVNNIQKFRSFHEGALCNRFSVPLYCPMPDRALLRRILEREVVRIPDGNPAWIDPALDFALDVEKTYQARRIKAIMTNGRDRLLDGSYQAERTAMLKAEESDSGREGDYTTF